MKKFVIGSLLVVTPLAALTVLASPASAGNVCSPTREQQVIKYAPDKHRVRATCSRLDTWNEARGTVGNSAYTAWFSSTYTVHYSPWKTFLSTPGVWMQYR